MSVNIIVVALGNIFQTSFFPPIIMFNCFFFFFVHFK